MNRMVTALARRSWAALVLRWLFAVFIGTCLASNLHAHSAIAHPCEEPWNVIEANHDADSDAPLHISKVQSPPHHLECPHQIQCDFSPLMPFASRAGSSDFDKRAATKVMAFYLRMLHLLNSRTSALRPKSPALPDTPPPALPTSLVLLPSVILTI
jgi:hypothetical protein